MYRTHSLHDDLRRSVTDHLVLETLACAYGRRLPLLVLRDAKKGPVALWSIAVAAGAGVLGDHPDRAVVHQAETSERGVYQRRRCPRLGRHPENWGEERGRDEAPGNGSRWKSRVFSDRCGCFFIDGPRFLGRSSEGQLAPSVVRGMSLSTDLRDGLPASRDDVSVGAPIPGPCRREFSRSWSLGRSMASGDGIRCLMPGLDVPDRPVIAVLRGHSEHGSGRCADRQALSGSRRRSRPAYPRGRRRRTAHRSPR